MHGPHQHVEQGGGHSQQGQAVARHLGRLTGARARLPPNGFQVPPGHPDRPKPNEYHGPVALGVQDHLRLGEAVVGADPGEVQAGGAEPAHENGLELVEEMEEHHAAEDVHRAQVDHHQHQRHDADETRNQSVAELVVVVGPEQVEGRHAGGEIGADIVELGQQNHAEADPEQAVVEQVRHPPPALGGQVQGHLGEGKGELLGPFPLALEDHQQAEAEHHNRQGHPQPVEHGPQPAVPGQRHALGQAVPE